MAFELYDVVDRGKGQSEHKMSSSLQLTCFRLAYAEVVAFLTGPMGLEAFGTRCVKTSFKRFNATLEKAYAKRLLGHGGVPERNFLALWLIADILGVENYVESGIFKGSSVFGVASASNIKTVTGLDPDLSNWAATGLIDNVALSLSTDDFSSYNFGAKIENSLAYFDDHINSAMRIIQAHDKGFKRVCFDDSCGVMGTAERVWPSLPSIFFIMNVEHFSVGDYIAWPREVTTQRKILGGRLTLSFLRRRFKCRFELTQEIIDLCYEAKSRIKLVGKIPDLNDFIVTRRNIRPNDITQHMVVLN